MFSLFLFVVLKPLVDVLSDPDYINRMLLAQLEHREQVNEHHKKAYTYAPSYEEFIKLISSSSDVQFLKQLRYENTQRPVSAILHSFSGAYWCLYVDLYILYILYIYIYIYLCLLSKLDECIFVILVSLRCYYSFDSYLSQ